MSLEYLSDDVLLNEILVQLPLSKLMQLCQSNKRFQILCQSDSLWENRAKYELSPEMLEQLVSQYSQTPFTWRNFYQYMMASFPVPVYLNGDIIDHQRVYYHNLQLTISNLVTMQKPYYSVIFLDDYSQPIVYGIYPSFRLKFLLENVQSITKILLIERISHSLPINDGPRNNNDQIIKNLKTLIYVGLTSTLSKFPLYAIYENNQLKFLHSTDQGRLCSALSVHELNTMIKMLDIHNISQMSKDQLCQRIADELASRGHFHRFIAKYTY